MSKAYVDEEEMPLPEGCQGAQGIDSLIFFRLVGANCRPARLAQFMLFYPKVKKRNLTEALCRSEESGRAPWTFIVSLRKTIKK